VHQNVNTQEGSALVRLEPDQRFRPRCHACGQAARTVHSPARKFVRDLDFGSHQMLLQVEYRKVWCDTCAGVRVEQLEFVEASARVTRRLAAYAAQLCKVGLSVELLKGSKYLLLRRSRNLQPQQRVQVKEILANNTRLNMVYWLKDFLRHLWTYRSRRWADGSLEGWCLAAEDEGHPLLRKFAAKLRNYRWGILNHCDHAIGTSKLEGVNNKIKVIKRVAYGSHDLEYFALKVKQALPGRASAN
jgi:transposase